MPIGFIYMTRNQKELHTWWPAQVHVSPTSRWYRKHSADTSFISLTTPGTNPDDVLCVALEVGQGATGCCCCWSIGHCVHHPRAFLRLVVNCNKVNTHGHTLTWPLPWYADTCVVSSSFSCHFNWGWYICAMELLTSNCYKWILCTQFYYLQQTLALLCYSVWPWNSYHPLPQSQ